MIGNFAIRPVLLINPPILASMKEGWPSSELGMGGGGGGGT